MPLVLFLTLPLSPYTTVATTTLTVGLSMGPVLWYSDPTAVDSRRYYAIHRCSQCNRVKNMRDWWTIGEQSTTACVCVCDLRGKKSQTREIKLVYIRYRPYRQMSTCPLLVLFSKTLQMFLSVYERKVRQREWERGERERSQSNRLLRSKTLTSETYRLFFC